MNSKEILEKDVDLIDIEKCPLCEKNPKPSKELLEALREGEDILNGKIEAKSYSSIEDLINALEEED